MGTPTEMHIDALMEKIENLQAENARLREALEFIAKVSKNDPASSWAEYHAREALEGEE